jgi:hypothetical protein
MGCLSMPERCSQMEHACWKLCKLRDREGKVIHLRITTQHVLLQILLASNAGWATSKNGRRSRCAAWRADSWSARRNGKRTATSLNATKLELSRTKLTSCSCLLLEHLLLVGVGISDLDDVLFSAGFGYWSVVELLNDVLADLARLKAVNIRICCW